jgi:hypothetical protein
LEPFKEIGFKRISAKNDIQLIDSSSKALRAVEDEGATTTVADGNHSNSAGHCVMASALKSYFGAYW